MSLAIAEKIRSIRATEDAKDQGAYRTLCQALGTGRKMKPDEGPAQVARILEAAGRSTEDLERHVEAVRREAELRMELKKRAEKEQAQAMIDLDAIKKRHARELKEAIEANQHNEVLAAELQDESRYGRAMQRRLRPLPHDIGVSHRPIHAENHRLSGVLQWLLRCYEELKRLHTDADTAFLFAS